MRSHRSRSTVRHELKVAERDMARLQELVDRLTDALHVAGTDHEALARIGADLASHEAELATAEEEWLERSAELDEIDASARGRE